MQSKQLAGNNSTKAILISHSFS